MKEEKLLTVEDERLLKEFTDNKNIAENIDGNGLGKDDANEEN